MENRWNTTDAKACGDGLLSLRVYSSRLLGADPALVLHGGGNTSIKTREENFFGETEDILHVKGSGWDLATIEREGFAPLRLETVMKLATQENLTDVEMVRELRSAMTDPNAPTPSVEAILHGIIPFKVVDHTHADAIIALTNREEGEKSVLKVYGNRVLVVPFIMPGFVLARKIWEMTRDIDWSTLEGIILLEHGIFTFADDVKASYDDMIKLVEEAEAYAKVRAPGFAPATANPQAPDLLTLAESRREISVLRGQAVLARLCATPEAVGYSKREDIESLSTRGPLTPDHTLRTKRVPVVFGSDNYKERLELFVSNYENYFQRFGASETMLDPAPRWAVWNGYGTVSYGSTTRECGIIEDISRHTVATTQLAEAMGGWRALSEQNIFSIEYWALEQAKLRNQHAPASLQGKIALVTGAAAGIGLACLQALHEAGAAVVGLDLNPEIETLCEGDDMLGIACNLTDDDAVKAAVETCVRQFGGLDIIVSNAGIFTAGAYIDEMDSANWDKSVAVNLTSHQRLLQFTIPYLKRGIDATAIFVGSRNVQAPGAGAASYSVTKAGLTQLVRVAALELAPHNVRVNIIHPDAVFDTKLWTPEALQRSADRYGLTVEEYKTRNLMKTEITSRDVGRMVTTMAGPAFFKTTGAQIPLDGGNDRVI